MSSYPLGYSQLAAAQAQLEGYNTPGSAPNLANNPGSLQLGNLGYGTMQVANGQSITVFPSPSAGLSALYNQYATIANGQSQYYTPNTSLTDFGNTYSGGNSSYGANLAKMLGVSPTSTIGSILNGTAGSASQSAGQSSSTGQQVWNLLFGNHQQSVNALGQLGTKATGSAVDVIFSSRVIIFLIGLMLIGAGLFSLRGTQSILETTTRTVKKGAEVATE